MEYSTIDMEKYPRRAHFEYFSSMPEPKAGITVKMDVTEAVRFAREKKASFYTVFIHLVDLAANSVPQLRQRARENTIIEYKHCDTSHIELLEDGTYCYCTLRHDMPWNEYLKYAEKTREKYRSNPSIEEDEDVENYYFITCLPWLSYESITMPITGTKETNPQMCWGRFEDNGAGKYIMPVTLTASHALLDGVNFAAFFDALRHEIVKLAE